MKPSIVIIGAGLGGCVLADDLANNFHVTVIDLNKKTDFLHNQIDDLQAKTIIKPHVSCGLGGTTRFWHNGLIEIDSIIFDEIWPFSKSELDEFYKRAFFKLSGVKYKMYVEFVDKLKASLISNQIQPALLGNPLFYPTRRINTWKKFNLKKRVNFILVEDVEFKLNQFNVNKVIVTKNSEKIEIEANLFVISAGGIGTPVILQNLMKSNNLPALSNAGHYYEDHPTAFVGEVVLSNPIYKFWNYAANSWGKLRIPFVIQDNGMLISFQLRPSNQFKTAASIKSIVSDLRNFPFRIENYLLLFKHTDDLLEILSFKLGLRFPTNRYTILMVAQQLCDGHSSIIFDCESKRILRKWTLSQSYLDSLEKSINNFILSLGSQVLSSKIYQDWTQNITSSAHHSGTARMSETPKSGVCDLNGKVFSIENLYVCDGSLIPGSGYANTGLTIAALALKMAAHLRGIYLHNKD